MDELQAFKQADEATIETEERLTEATSQNDETNSDRELDSLMRIISVQSTQSFILVSNLMFLTGSLLYLGIAIWDCIGNDDDTTDDNSIIKVDDEPSMHSLQWNSRDMLAAAAPFIFLVVSIVDMRYAFQVIQNNREPCRFGDDPRWEFGVAILFGTAATCDFIAAVILRDEDTMANYLPRSLATHFYVIMAIFALWGRDVPDRTFRMRMYQAADAMFLIGALIDVTLGYFQMPGISSKLDTILEHWAVASASLWVVNSIMYMLADTCLVGNVLFNIPIQQLPQNQPRVPLDPVEEQPSADSSSHFDETRSRIDSKDSNIDNNNENELYVQDAIHNCSNGHPA
jgi:hypothetical protein